jgi:hypothetical protein
MASAAAAPPCSLFEVMRLARIEASAIVVSTVITGIFAFTYCFIGLISAVSFVGAISSASGCLANNACNTGICISGENEVPPCQIRSSPSFFASSAAPRSIVM